VNYFNIPLYTNGQHGITDEPSLLTGQKTHVQCQETSLSPNLIFHHLRGTVHLNHIRVPQGLNSLYSSYTAT